MINRKGKTLIFAGLIATAARAGTSDHGGHGVIGRLLLSRPYAIETISLSKNPRLSPEIKQKMLTILQAKPAFSREPIYLPNENGIPVEVDAKYNSESEVISFNLPRIERLNSSLEDLVMLHLHEAGHRVRLSKNMAILNEDFRSDIGYILFKEIWGVSKESTPRLLTSMNHYYGNLSCVITLQDGLGSEMKLPFSRSAEEWQKDHVVFSRDLVLPSGEVVNVHIYYSSEFASINIFHEASDFYLNNDSYVNGGKSFSLRYRSRYSKEALKGAGVECRLDK
jgi:hypothetical protein